MILCEDEVHFGLIFIRLFRFPFSSIPLSLMTSIEHLRDRIPVDVARLRPEIKPEEAVCTGSIDVDPGTGEGLRVLFGELGAEDFDGLFEVHLMILRQKFGCPFALELSQKIAVSKISLFFNAGRSRNTVSRSCGGGRIRKLSGRTLAYGLKYRDFYF